MFKIYCIGDSHVDLFKKLDYCEVISMSATLAYTLKDRIPSIYMQLNHYLEEQKPDDYCLLFVFGEIDIRAHLVKYNNITECVERYVEALSIIAKQGHKVSVFGPIGSTRRKEKRWNIYPVVGDCVQRNCVAKQFDMELSEECKNNNLKYISILDQLIDEEGLTIEKYYLPDRIHLNCEALPLVEPKLKKLYDLEGT